MAKKLFGKIGKLFSGKIKTSIPSRRKSQIMFEQMEERRLCSITNVSLDVQTASADCKEGSPITMTLTPTVTTGDSVLYYTVRWDASNDSSPSPEIIWPDGSNTSGGVTTISHTFADAGVGTNFNGSSEHQYSGNSTTFPVYVTAVSAGEGDGPWDQFSGQVAGVTVYDVPPTVTATLTKSDYWADEDVVVDYTVSDPGTDDIPSAFYVDLGDGSDIDGDGLLGGWVPAANLTCSERGDYELRVRGEETHEDVTINNFITKVKESHAEGWDDPIITDQIDIAWNKHAPFELVPTSLHADTTGHLLASFELHYHGLAEQPEAIFSVIDFSVLHTDAQSGSITLVGAEQQYDGRDHLLVYADEVGSVYIDIQDTKGTPDHTTVWLQVTAQKENMADYSDLFTIYA